MIDLSNNRKDYTKNTLLEENLEGHAMDQFHVWYSETERILGTTTANIMTLATSSKTAVPKSRVVLLKKYDEEGFIFFTNYNSSKGQDLNENPRACLNFFWEPLERQITVIGSCEKISKEESDNYFYSRPLKSQIAAITSNQSQVIDSRKTLEEKFKKFEKTHESEPLKRPEHWGGYLIKPSQVEFWQGRGNRLHDRILYTKTNSKTWNISRLCP